MIYTYPIFDAKVHLSRLLRMVEDGHEIVITRGRKGHPEVPIAKIVPYSSLPNTDTVTPEHKLSL
jgi:prevent-host-death family protein